MKALLEVILGQSNSSNEILGGLSIDRVTLELVERVERIQLQQHRIAPKLNLKMDDICTTKMFDGMPTRDDEVKVDKHIDAVCGSLNTVQNLITLSKIDDFVWEFPMSYVVETLMTDGSDNPPPKIIAPRPSIGTSNPNLNIMP
ncbi:hypothetical protein V6N12_051591 [Hibiscus sabdariffa]|uniref:Uncharacterized protein n=1 Tax=Hibiscus sabdariffa TaxID=183260 RepID=A0ABR2GGK6_9ROSI